MADPVTLTVGSIAALAFTKFLESSAGEAAKNLTPAVLRKIDTLREKILVKLQEFSVAKKLDADVKANKKVTEQQIKDLTPHLEKAMGDNTDFAQEVQQLVSEINQEINIGELMGKNVQNVYGGSPVQINDPNAPILTGDISGGTFTFNTTSY